MTDPTPVYYIIVVKVLPVDKGDKTQGILYSGMQGIPLKWISPTGF